MSQWTLHLGTSATVSSGLAVTLASNTSTVCSVSGVTVTILASGGCSITASQAGNATFAPAPSVTQNFTVPFTDVVSIRHHRRLRQ